MLDRNICWLVRFVEHRIGDARIIRLIRKWLQAGILGLHPWPNQRFAVKYLRWEPYA